MKDVIRYVIRFKYLSTHKNYIEDSEEYLTKMSDKFMRSFNWSLTPKNPKNFDLIRRMFLTYDELYIGDGYFIKKIEFFKFEDFLRIRRNENIEEILK